jgi:hypothetical protein
LNKFMLSSLRLLYLIVIAIFVFLPVSSQAVTDSDFKLMGKAHVDECFCGLGDLDNIGVGYDNKPSVVTLTDGSTCEIADLLANINGTPAMGACTGDSCEDILDDVTNDITTADPFFGTTDPRSESNNDPSTCFCGEDDPENGAPPPGVSCTAGTCVGGPTPGLACTNNFVCGQGGSCTGPSYIDGGTNDGTCSTTIATDCSVDMDCPGGESCVIHGICTGGVGNNGEPCEVAGDCPGFGGTCSKGCVNGDSLCFCYDTTPPTVSASAIPPADNADCSLISPLPASTSMCVPGDTCVNKTNMTYNWGGGYDMVTDTAVVGAGPNTACRATSVLSISGLGGSAASFDFGAGVCEGDLSTFPEPADFVSEGDLRPPEVWFVDDITGGPDPANNQHKIDLTACPNNGYDLVKECGGFRSVGIMPQEGIAIAAGQRGRGVQGVIMVLIDIASGTCLEVKNFSEYNDIRKWEAHNGALYTTVGNTAGQGSIIRCTGCEQTPPTLLFETVGHLNSMGANITYCPSKNRFMVDTWPNSNVADIGELTSLPGSIGGIFGGGIIGIITGIPDILDAITTFLGTLEDVGQTTLYMSPVVPPHVGLTPDDADSWDILWTMNDYDPNWVTYQTSGGGGLACNEEYLYWGTMQVGGTGTILHALLFEPDLVQGNPLMCVGGSNANNACTDPTTNAECPGGGICTFCSCSGFNFFTQMNVDCTNSPDPSCCVFGTNPQTQTFCQRSTDAQVNNVRPTSVFRIKDFGSLITDPTIELLYGEQQLPVYATSVFQILLAQIGLANLGWTMEPNNLAPGGLAPICGRSGISHSPGTPGSQSRLYTWDMTECNGGNILLGTYDAADPSSGNGGADLYSFIDDQCAVALTETGGNNKNMYGWRITQCVGGNAFLGGMATATNKQVVTGTTPPFGGWELRLLQNLVGPFPPVTP